jgi:hypothetical protein
MSNKLYKSICPVCKKLIETCNNPQGKDCYHGDCFKKAGLSVGGVK